MTTLYEIIKSLQTTKGSKAKKAILEQHRGDELLQQYLKAVYDPRINYYTTKIPKASKVGVYDLSEESAILPLLEYHATRNLTGKAAQYGLECLAESLTAEGQELLGYIIKRDIKAGIAEGTILDVWPELFYIPPYQRASTMSDKVKAKFSGLKYFFLQPKLDGAFAYLIKRQDGTVEAMTRNGSVYPTWLTAALATGVPSGFVLAGEMLVYRWNANAADGNGEWIVLSRKEGNGILNKILQGDDEFSNIPDNLAVKMIAWDMLTEGEFCVGRSERTYQERLDLMSVRLEYQAPHVKIVDHYNVTSMAEAIKINTDLINRGMEGSVIKNPAMKWRDCSSGDPDMVKLKVVFEADYEIEGAYEGEGKYVGMLGGFMMKTSDGLIKFNVGSGLSDAQRKEYWSLILEEGADYFNGNIVAIEGNDIVTSEGKDTESVFLPIFIELRRDKTVADSRERVWEQFNAAKEGRAT